MPPDIHTASGNGAVRTVAGWILSGLVIVFLLLDSAIKLVPIHDVITTLAKLGYPADASFARGLGVLLLVCTLLYALPRTAFLGAILLTAYLGGAVAAHVRIGSPLLSHVLFGVYLGLFVWGGLYLREDRLRAVIPFDSGEDYR